MLIEISKDKLLAFLTSNEDCEALTADEYVVDLYDMDTPITIDLRIVKEGAEILAAAELLYDEEQDGWYMGERIEDEARISEALKAAMEAVGENT